MKKTVDAVKEAGALLKKGWTKGVNARDAKLQTVAPNSPDAVRFCAMGAIHRATNYNLTLRDRVVNALTAANPNVPSLSWNLTGYNDSSKTKDRVVKLFDNAVTYLNKKSKKKIRTKV